MVGGSGVARALSFFPRKPHSSSECRHLVQRKGQFPQQSPFALLFDSLAPALCGACNKAWDVGPSPFTSAKPTREATSNRDGNPSGLFQRLMKNGRPASGGNVVRSSSVGKSNTTIRQRNQKGRLILACRQSGGQPNRSPALPSGKMPACLTK
jgi:hypothetical protein